MNINGKIKNNIVAGLFIFITICGIESEAKTQEEIKAILLKAEDYTRFKNFRAPELKIYKSQFPIDYRQARDVNGSMVSIGIMNIKWGLQNTIISNERGRFFCVTKNDKVLDNTMIKGNRLRKFIFNFYLFALRPYMRYDGYTLSLKDTKYGTIDCYEVTFKSPPVNRIYEATFKKSFDRFPESSKNYYRKTWFSAMKFTIAKGEAPFIHVAEGFNYFGNKTHHVDYGKIEEVKLDQAKFVFPPKVKIINVKSEKEVDSILKQILMNNTQLLLKK